MQDMRSTLTERGIVERSPRTKGMLELAIVGTLVIIVGDTQGLSLIPLIGQLQTDFGLSAAQVGWIIAATALSGASAVPTLLRMGDRWGMRKILLGSLAIGTLANVLAAVAPDGQTTLLIARILLGLTGVSTPIMYAILRDRAKSQEELQSGTGILTAATGFGVAIGFLIGGVVVHLDGTARTVFWITAAMSLVVLVAAYLLVPEIDTRTDVPLDVVGVVLLAAGMFAISLGFNKGGEWGWGTGLSVVAAGVVIIALFCVWELRIKHPMVDLRVISNLRVMPAMIATAVLGGALATVASLTTSTFVQTPAAVGYGLTATPLEAAFYLMPIAVFAVIGGSLATFVIRLTSERIAAAGSTLLLIPTFLWMAANHSEPWNYIVGLSIFGACFAVGYAALYAMFLSGARRGEAGLVTGAGSMFIVAAAGGGVTAFTVLLTSKMVTLPANPPVQIPDGQNYALLWLLAAGMAGLCFLLVAITKRPIFSEELAENAVTVGH